MASYLERLENMDDEYDEDDDEYSYAEDDSDDEALDADMVDSGTTSDPITEESLDSEAFLEEVEQFLRSQHDD
jgi:hypothetical protein